MTATMAAKKGATHRRHAKANETPVPIYVGMKVHAETRKQVLVDCLHTLGLSISYKRWNSLWILYIQ